MGPTREMHLAGFIWVPYGIHLGQTIKLPFIAVVVCVIRIDKNHSITTHFSTGRTDYTGLGFAKVVP